MLQQSATAFTNYFRSAAATPAFPFADNSRRKSCKTAIPGRSSASDYHFSRPWPTNNATRNFLLSNSSRPESGHGSRVSTNRRNRSDKQTFEEGCRNRWCNFCRISRRSPWLGRSFPARLTWPDSVPGCPKCCLWSFGPENGRHGISSSNPGWGLI